ncbi:MAG TPA: helix-turn-helix domain-containing protein [Cryobacterium sp.]|nr:helix-turn-helix domain-containing protein [Cryobacterium sp.]
MTPRPVFPPLDPAAASERARQVAALVDPARLRVLSALVSDPDGVHTAGSIGVTLDIDHPDATAHLQVLLDAGLVTTNPAHEGPAYIPSPDAWIRFGRMLVPALVRAPSAMTTMAAAAETGLPPVIQQISNRLAYRFSSYFSKETVQRYVAESYALLQERAKVTRHLPSLTSRFATDRLSALATSQGLHLSGTPEVLFVCVQNAGRSQMAAGLLRQLAGTRVNVRTAGSQPAPVLDDMVVTVLDEIGVPTLAEFPKPLTDEVVQAADVVITMGCGDACPIYPGRRYLDWPIPDPAGLSIEEVRIIRDEILERVGLLMRGLGFDLPER